MNSVLLYIYLEIPPQNGEHSSKCTELSLKRKEGTGRTTGSHIDMCIYKSKIQASNYV